MRYILLFTLVCYLISCNQKSNTRELSPHIGLIEYDPKIDTLGFNVCHEDLMYPYFHHQDLSFEGEKPALVNKYTTRYTPSSAEDSGYITIRFIVNCEGLAGRFRVIQMDKNYESKAFDNELIMQLYDITRSLKGWDILNQNDVSFDYVRYLTFKIDKGEIIDIMP